MRENNALTGLAEDLFSPCLSYSPLPCNATQCISHITAMARTSLAGIYKALKSLEGQNELILYCGTDIDFNFVVGIFVKDLFGR